ncbi:FAD-binding oxidoreductase [Chryseolinea sp. T2]|uniref:FAD-binding oxidoreductase n=1 Tax=Chryseolinea sp. T2 TaxID=3129255 RepID=UPI0030785A2C
MEVPVKIISAEYVTHDVKQFRVERPADYSFVPGQATEVSVNLPEWKDRKSPFTFTALTDKPYLEFTIKIYPDRHGVTDQLSNLRPGDELILRDVWGAIEYKGPGYFIAGGAGITPFLAILRMLKATNQVADNILFFSNKRDEDIILGSELKSILGDRAHFLITQQKDTKNDRRRIDEAFLKAEVNDFSRHFYVCGPDPMIAAINETLVKLGAKPDSVVFEK